MEELDPSRLEWKAGRSVPLAEFTFRADPSPGPGGQHANRSSTRITLLWSPSASSAFDFDEKQRLIFALRNRTSGEGVVTIRSSKERSAYRNKQECLELLSTLIAQALRPVKKRKATRPSRSSKERRLHSKRLASVKKGARGESRRGRTHGED